MSPNTFGALLMMASMACFTVNDVLIKLTGGAVPLYRLRFGSGLPRQHWTTDLNEYNTLPTRGWVQEGIVGYILP